MSIEPIEKVDGIGEGWIKVNFDGAFKGNLRIIGTGCVIKDAKDNILILGAKHLPDGTNDAAKCMAVIFALLLARKCEEKKVLLQVDSHLVINGITKGKMESWHLDKFTRRIKRLLGDFEEFKVTQTKRRK